jgi:hypothetical protein
MILLLSLSYTGLSTNGFKKISELWKLKYKAK